MNVSPGEKITRFIWRSRNFSEPNIVRHGAFLPRNDQVDISVFRISALIDGAELSGNDIWKIGRKYVHTAERPVKARADLLVDSVYEANLKVVPVEPPQRHASIMQLPVDNSPANRMERRDIATKLAKSSKLVMLPEDIIDSCFKVN